MGWLVGWDTRAELVEHLRADVSPGLKILAERSTAYGRNLWWACEDAKGERFILLFLIRGNARSERSWGYKDIDEKMGPCETDCPLDLFDLVPEPTGDDQGSKWARDWRVRVRAHHARRGQAFALGDRVIVHGWVGPEYTVIGRHRRSYVVERDGNRFRVSPEKMTPASEREVSHG